MTHFLGFEAKAGASKLCQELLFEGLLHLGCLSISIKKPEDL